MERKNGKVTITWADLSEFLTKVGALTSTEDIGGLTLTNPRKIVIETLQTKKKEE